MNSLRSLLKMNHTVWRQCGRGMTTKIDSPTSQMHTTTAGDVKKDRPTSDANDAVKPDADTAELSEKIVFAQAKVLQLLKDIDCKLPIWQGKISQAMQSVQDFITSKFVK